jgi:hypothetical protein
VRGWFTGILLCVLSGASLAERAVQSGPEQLRALQQRMEALRDELNQSESAQREARDELRASEKAISDATRALRNISSQRKDIEAALLQTRRDIAAGEEKLAIQQARLTRLLRGHQRAGEADALRHLLSGSDPNQSARDLHYLRSLSRSQLALMNSHRDALASQRELLARQDEQLAQLRVLEGERETERKRLASEHDVRRKVLERISTQLRTERRELATLKRDEARLSRLIEALSKKSVRTPPRAPAPGGSTTPDRPEPLAAPRAAGLWCSRFRWIMAGSPSSNCAENCPGRRAENLRGASVPKAAKAEHRCAASSSVRSRRRQVGGRRHRGLRRLVARFRQPHHRGSRRPLSEHLWQQRSPSEAGGCGREKWREHRFDRQQRWGSGIGFIL